MESFWNKFWWFNCRKKWQKCLPGIKCNGFEPEIFGLVDLHTLTIRPLLHKLCKVLLVFSPAKIELKFQCTLNMKYTSSIILEIFWLPKFVNLWKELKSSLDLYVSSILWVHQEFSNEVYFKCTSFWKKLRSINEL